MPTAELPTCVFCGQPIGPGQESAGRAPMAAHASCADAALADDAHWDQISRRAEGGPERADAPTSGDGTARQPGCLGVIGLVALMLAARLILT